MVEGAGTVNLSLQIITGDVLLFSRGLRAGTDVRVLDIQGRTIVRVAANANQALLPALSTGRYVVEVREPGAGVTVLPMVRP